MYTDFGYMEEGKLGKPYDLKLMARLGGFLKPYWKLMGLSLVFVLIMAGLDLIIPYLTKEAIDRYNRCCGKRSCLKRRRLAGGTALWNQYGEKFIAGKEKGKFLLPPETLQSMDRKEMVLFQKYDLLTEARYYLFVPKTPEEESLLKKYPPC